MKNNVPKYLLINFAAAEKEQYVVNEDVHSISQRLIADKHQAYEELAE